MYDDLKSITCTTPATDGGIGFAKFNTPLDSTHSVVANVCYIRILKHGFGFQARGSFMVDASGNFVNSAGLSVLANELELTSDSGASDGIFYANAKSIWEYLKDKDSSSIATPVRLAFGNTHCFDALSTSTACTLGVQSSGVLSEPRKF